MEIKKQTYTLKSDGKSLDFYKNEELFVSLPLAFSLNGVTSELSLSEWGEDSLSLSGKSDSLLVRFFDDCVTLSYKKTFSEPTPIYEARAFAGGITLPKFDRAFTPQARNNSHKNLDWFAHYPDISSNGYFTPPLLQFSIGSEAGFVSFGLLDVPDTKICRLEEDMTFLVQSSGGNITIPAGEEYVMPKIAVYFPKDEWESISDFRALLIKHGKYTPEKKKYSDLPSWWKNPMVCIYGDQLLGECVGQGIDEAWVRRIVEQAEDEWEIKDFNLVIDDSWQLAHSFSPVADEKRFPNLRAFIEEMHERSHRVLLWTTPLMDKITNGFVTKSQKLGVTTSYECPSPYYKDFPGTYFLDYTADNAGQFIRETVEYLFGHGEGQLNADGVKLDFLANHRDPALTNTYSDASRGIGMKEMLLFYKTFYEEAKKVKPEAIIDATVGDPRFERYVDFNRMHDTHSGNLEKELRVRVSTLACPELPVDSDGALMFKAWLKPHYVDAAVYGIPANYYTDKYQDYRMTPEGFDEKPGARTPEPYETLSVSEKKQLARLFGMSKHRPDGTVKFTGRGWTLFGEDGRVNALSLDGATVVYYPTKENKLGYLFTFRDEAIEIPLFDRHFGKLSEPAVHNNVQVDYARDRVFIHLKPGTVYTFEDVDDGNSIDRAFFGGKTRSAEGETDYVN